MSKCYVEVWRINSRFLTVHELKQLVDHSFEELPVGSEKTWILANDVHDVGGYDGLVVLPSLLLTQTQQILRQSRSLSINKHSTWATNVLKIVWKR